jgi:putative transposase
VPTRFYPVNIYHLYNRGNDRQRIFLEAENYRFFLSRLVSYFQKADVDLLAYCLMPNHYHALVRLQREIDFSNVLRGFNSSYVKSFNSWHGKVGHLFQDTTHAKLVEDEQYLTHVCRYVHLNPVVAGLARSPQEWEFSDYAKWSDCSADTSMAIILLRDALFSSADQYRRFVLDYSAELKTRREIEARLFDLR